jgi:putative transposase
VQLETKELRSARGVVLRHFSARDMVSRWDVVEVHERGTSLAAAHFLDSLLNRMPFRVAALQVDGGSEFAAEFETAFQSAACPLRAPAALTHSMGRSNIFIARITRRSSR